MMYFVKRNYQLMQTKTAILKEFGYLANTRICKNDNFEKLKQFQKQILHFQDPVLVYLLDYRQNLSY